MSQIVSPEMSPGEVSDLKGEEYTKVLASFHARLKPRSYLEIGVCTGRTMADVSCPSIGIDPRFKIAAKYLYGLFSKKELHLFQVTSDEFFENHSPTKIFGRPIDIAFLDGMHLCEFLLRDFIAVERHCNEKSLVILHDCLPVEAAIAERVQDTSKPTRHRKDWWTGDVWRTALLLKRYRPDLLINAVDAAPTGLIFVQNLDPESTVLSDGYDGYVSEMMSWDLVEIGIKAFFNEMNVGPVSSIEKHAALMQAGNFQDHLSTSVPH